MLGRIGAGRNAAAGAAIEARPIKDGAEPAAAMALPLGPPTCHRSRRLLYACKAALAAAVMNETALPDEIPCVLRPSREEEIDDTAYLAANPDAAKAGRTARQHFRDVGRADGRLQWANQDCVARMRAQKLARVRFLNPTNPDVTGGEALNFLPADTLAALGMPEDTPISAHPYGQSLVELIEANRDRLFLDVGAGSRHTYYANVVNTDIYPSGSTDVLCAAESLPFADEQFDFIFCLAVLEHTMRPWDAAREMCRVLKPGGRIIVDWPFLQPVHGYPHHYFNATPTGNQSLFEPYCDIVSIAAGEHQHPLVAVNMILDAWRIGLPGAVARRFERMTVGSLIRDPLAAQLARDYCTDLPAVWQQRIASGSMMTAVKRAVPVPGSTPGVDWAAAGLARRNAVLVEQLDRMERSMSWRITAPLRSLVRWLRSARA